GHRNLDGAHVDNHGVRHHPARCNQPLGRRRAGAHTDGGRRHRCSIRGTGGSEDAERTPAPPARNSGAGCRIAVCIRPCRCARRCLLDPHHGGRAMNRNSRPRILIACVVASFLLVVWALPAGAERLVSSLSSHIVRITSNFTGVELVLFGTVENDQAIIPRIGGYDIVTTVTGPRQSVVTRRKERMFGIWVNAESRSFVEVPSYLEVLSTRPFES